MVNFYSDEFLRMLRNEFVITGAISISGIESRHSNGITRFRCPCCHSFHTATNSETNLGRCFDCKTNFNPIDLVMAVFGYNFLETVEFLKKHINKFKKSN